MAQKTFDTTGKITRLDPALDAFVASDARVEVLATGFRWSEGPAWIKNGGFLIFSDVPNNVIHKWSEAGGLEDFLRPSGYTGRGPYSDEPGSNGLTVNQKGEIVACECGDRRITAMPLENGGKLTLADRWQGKRFNSPNDVVQHPGGAYYFTDPPYGLPGKEHSTIQEIKEYGVYRIGTDGSVTQVVSDLQRPNGLAFTSDGQTMYLSNSDPDRPVIMAYDVQPDGSLQSGRVFFDTTPYAHQGLPGLPDGMRLDAHGNLFASGPGGIMVITPKGQLLGRIETGDAVANCQFGGPDGSVLYLTSGGRLCRVQTLTKGQGW